MEAPRYEIAIRTPAMQARHDRRCRMKRYGFALALLAALLAPAGADKAAPALCAHVWVC